MSRLGENRGVEGRRVGLSRVSGYRDPEADEPGGAAVFELEV